MVEYKKIHKVSNFCVGKDVWLLGPDHLLVVKKRGYSEDYRRFFFSDIQWGKVSTERFLTFLVCIPAVLSFVLLLVAIFLFWQNERGAAAVFVVLASLPMVCLLAVWLLGPYSSVTIKTFAEKETLRSGRLSKALRAAALIKADVDRAQGALSNEELVSRLLENEENGGGRTDI